MALDTLSQALKVDCCWVQTINSRKQTLVLAASRGFSAGMRTEVSALNMSHGFSKRIIGLGHNVVIADLSNDGRYGLPSFRAAGYRWLVAVPMMTYRVHGILGIASGNRKQLQRETADLALVLAGMLGTALNKANLYQKSLKQHRPAPQPAAGEKQETKQPVADVTTAVKAAPQVEEKAVPGNGASAPEPAPPLKTVARQRDDRFHKHTRRMDVFRRSHS